MELCELLKSHCTGFSIGLESTGTYGDVVRYALGLNLKERSSGTRPGQLAISKRGPAMSRRWLFYRAMRAVQRDELKGWYEAFIQVGNGSHQWHATSRSQASAQGGEKNGVTNEFSDTFS